MIKVGIIEDDAKISEDLKQMIVRYGGENKVDFYIGTFGSADDFLRVSPKAFDLVFMDIELPGTDGMTAAERLHRANADAIIVFVTNIARLAVKGYAVNALDYLIKPVNAYSLGITLERAVKLLERHRGISVTVNTESGFICLDSSSVMYVEVYGHSLIYHTDSGDVREWGTLKKPESMLTAYGFARCNKCYLVNLRYVTDVTDDTVTVAGDKLRVSRGKRKSFMTALNEYYEK